MEKMISAYNKVGENRYRETYGLYYDDFEVGDIFEHRPGRTITEVDNIWQSLICMNNHPLHIDSAYGSKTEFKQNIISSLVTLSIVGGMSVNTISAKCIANLGWDKVRLTHPVFVGDTIYAESKVLHKRLSSKRQNQGIVTFETRGIKADGTVFMTYERTVLIPCRAYKGEETVDY
ncbi:MAG TPA: MaoC family dehydratase [Candidatus Deferrimicrobium sp.]|nr:MaoC family dehydratase [Candidatus Deferrimicrobium sp.]